MSKKHFRALAQELHRVRPSELAGRIADVQWEACIHAVAAVCAESNECFDRERFIEACENGLPTPRRRAGTAGGA